MLKTRHRFSLLPILLALLISLQAIPICARASESSDLTSTQEAYSSSKSDSSAAASGKTENSAAASGKTENSAAASTKTENSDSASASKDSEGEAAFDETYVRFNDKAEVITTEHKNELNQLVKAKKWELQMDFPVLVRKGLPEGYESYADFGKTFYNYNQFGYGESKDGILLILDVENFKFGIYYFGNARDLFTDEQDQELRQKFIQDSKDESLTYYDLFLNYYSNVFAMTETSRSGNDDGSPLSGSGKASWTRTDQPYWYPESISDFENFHGTDLPRVVDDAGILTEQEKAELSEIVERIVENYGISYVIFTDDNTYGRSKEVYSADFLYFNGYGAGEDYSAVVFFLCLQTGNRGWRTTSTNSCENIFTASITYEIDELVDSYMRSGQYFTALKLQAEYVEKLMKDLNNLPDWYPESFLEAQATRRTRVFGKEIDLSKPVIVDDAKILSAETEEIYSAKLQALREKYGVDLLVFTDSTTHRMSISDYGQDYYYYHGYAQEGLVMTLAKDGSQYMVSLDYFGNQEKIKDQLEKAEEKIQNQYDDDNSPEKALEYADYLLEHLFSRGRLPLEGIWYFLVIPAFILLSIWSRKFQKKLVKEMEITAVKDMGKYMVNGSRSVNGVKKYLLYTTVTKTRHIDYSSSSYSSSGSSSSSHSSSYSSGSSSSGGSYSSGGRDF